MKMPLASFNIYLLLLFTVLSIGCESPEARKKREEASTLRLFLEVPTGGDHGGGVPIYRANPMMISVEREPFLSEADLVSAAVIEVRGGFEIQAQFNGHAALLLENVTVSHKGRHIAIQSHWSETRWLAAPLITHRISNGEVVFTPDANREETERIVRGLTNVIEQVRRNTPNALRD